MGDELGYPWSGHVLRGLLHFSVGNIKPGLRNIRPAGRYEQMLSCNDLSASKPSEAERHWEPFLLGSP